MSAAPLPLLMRAVHEARMRLASRKVRATILELLPAQMPMLGMLAWSSHALGLILRPAEDGAAVVGIRKHGIFECVPPEREPLDLSALEGGADSSSRFRAILGQMAEEEMAEVARLNEAPLPHHLRELVEEERREEVDIHMRRVEALRAGMDCLTW